MAPLKRREGAIFSLQSRASDGGQNYCCKKTKKAFGKLYTIYIDKIYAKTVRVPFR
jgi:hypothetical protein